MFTVQIAIGVCFGLLLFRFVVMHPVTWRPRLPRITVPRVISACATLWVVLWVAHLLFTAAAAQP